MQNKIFIITGEQGSGKTTFLTDVVNGLKKSKVSVGGILAEGYWKNDQRDRFDLVNQATNEKVVFCQREVVEGWEKIRHFYINPEGQQFGENALEIDNLGNVDVIVVDEIGPFELKGKGWAEPVNQILSKTSIVKLLVIRKALLEEIVKNFRIKKYTIFEVGKESSAFASKEILKAL